MVSISRCTQSFAGHLNRSIDGIFETVRVVGRALVPLAEVHAKVARAQQAQRESEVSRNRFGLLERHRTDQRCRGIPDTGRNVLMLPMCALSAPRQRKPLESHDLDTTAR